MSGTLKIVPFSLNELEDVLAMEQLSYKSPWKREYFIKELENPHILLPYHHILKQTYMILQGSLIL